jgi:hypothetical protein
MQTREGGQLMPEPPELAYESVAPEVLTERLDIIRERFRTGLLTAADFNAALKAFQFNDELGHLWSPGATTGKWYRWDGDEWTAAAPPSRLKVSQSPILFTDFERQTNSRPSKPAGAVCPTCGASNVGKKFCTQCGTKLT